MREASFAILTLLGNYWQMCKLDFESFIFLFHLEKLLFKFVSVTGLVLYNL